MKRVCRFFWKVMGLPALLLMLLLFICVGIVLVVVRGFLRWAVYFFKDDFLIIKDGVVDTVYQYWYS